MRIKALDKPAEIVLDSKGEVILRVRRTMTKPEVRAWAHRHARIKAEDSLRVRELRARYTAEDWPELHAEPRAPESLDASAQALLDELLAGGLLVGGPGHDTERALNILRSSLRPLHPPARYHTEAYVAELYALLREVLAAVAESLTGVEVEGSPATITDPLEIVRVLEHVELLEAAGFRAANAQGPEVADVFC